MEDYCRWYNFKSQLWLLILSLTCFFRIDFNLLCYVKTPCRWRRQLLACTLRLGGREVTVKDLFQGVLCWMSKIQTSTISITTKMTIEIIGGHDYTRLGVRIGCNSVHIGFYLAIKNVQDGTPLPTQAKTSGLDNHWIVTINFPTLGIVLGYQYSIETMIVNF